MSDLDNEELEATRLLKNIDEKELDELIKSTEGSIEETCKFLKDNFFIEYKEKSADEMFEELGYEKIMITEKSLIYDKREAILIYAKILKNGDIRRISFHKNKTIMCTENIYDMARFDMQELQAINKKVSEMGWL